MGAERTIVQEVAELATQIPVEYLRGLAEAIRTSGSEGNIPSSFTLAQAIPNPHYRDIIGRFVTRWRSQCQAVSAPAVVLALEVADLMNSHANERHIELVWTGPPTSAVPARETEQVLLELILLARETLTVVSFGVYRIPRIVDALSQALDRGVRIRLIFGDREDAVQDSYTLLSRALGQDLLKRSAVYVWPRDQRPKDENGRSGLMHVKCAVADRDAMFITSANLTESAFELNMELGLKICKANEIAKVEQLFDQLVRDGILVPLHQIEHP